MEMKSGIFLLFFFFLAYAKVLNDPFPDGYSMGNLGTILWDKSYSGLQSSIPAAVCDYSLGKGFDLSVISYYDEMNNLQDKLIYQFSAGTFITTRFISLKINYSYFNALDTYYEQSLYCSTGLSIIPVLKFSIDLQGYRIGLNQVDTATHTMGEIGFTTWLGLHFAALSLQCNHLIFIKNNSGSEPAISIACGIHTQHSRFGAQGVIIEITPTESSPIRLKIGEEVRFIKWCGIQIAIANNPVQISFGLSIDLINTLTTASLVNQPELGWSKGIYIGYSLPRTISYK